MGQEYARCLVAFGQVLNGQAESQSWHLALLLAVAHVLCLQPSGQTSLLYLHGQVETAVSCADVWHTFCALAEPGSTLSSS